MKNGREEMENKILINREKVVALVAEQKENVLLKNLEGYLALRNLMDAIMALPSENCTVNAHWDFVINEERVGYYGGEFQSLYYNGYKCSHCGEGGGEFIPREYGKMTEREATVIFEGMNTKYCCNCGAKMENESNY